MVECVRITVKEREEVAPEIGTKELALIALAFIGATGTAYALSKK